MVIEKIFQAAIVYKSIIAPGKEEAAQETNLPDMATEVARQIPMSFGTASSTARGQRLNCLETGAPSRIGRRTTPSQKVQPSGSA